MWIGQHDFSHNNQKIKIKINKYKTIYICFLVKILCKLHLTSYNQGDIEYLKPDIFTEIVS